MSYEAQLSLLLHQAVGAPPDEITVDAIESRIRQSGNHHKTPFGNILRNWTRPVLVAAGAIALTATITVGVHTFTGHRPSGSERFGAAAPSELPTKSRDPIAVQVNPITQSSSSTPSSAAPPACRAAAVDLSVTATGSTASAPFIKIAVRNRAQSSCALDGYPDMELFSAAEPSLKVAIVVSHGTYETPDAGPSQVILQPGGYAWFALGASTAYPTGVLINRVQLKLPGVGQTYTLTLASPQELSATGPNGQPIPVGLTAFAAGTGIA